ncbi:UNKNOWN [Stylonychia lemnae]|uniref:Uncharacterized protein n=1 Tax=Stylonychia lemnae TaxID=5949 RepID=A0A077ZVA8_STYLE|nr:UNKNOWN [Stylonychia lemnae]|eukprot:CDW73245.1 UNKNOWN [Stylonychia lemnae]
MEKDNKVKQLNIDFKLLQHAKDFIPNMIEFKLTQVINGQVTTNKPQSKSDVKVYIPPRIKSLMAHLNITDKNELLKKHLINRVENEQQLIEDRQNQEDFKLNADTSAQNKFKKQEKKELNERVQVVTINDLTKDQMNDIKGSGWDSDNSITTKLKLREKRQKLEYDQKKQFPTEVFRQRDEWDQAYDAGKQKKIKTKNYKPFELQNRQFQSTYEDIKQHKKMGLPMQKQSHNKKRDNKFNAKKSVRIN